MSSTASRVRAANFCCFFCSRTRTELDSQMGLAWSAGPYSHPNEAIRKKVLMAFMPRRRGREKERSDCMECVICQGFFAPRPSCVLAPCFLRWWAAFLCRSVQHTSELIRISPSYGATRQQFFVIENVLHSRWQYSSGYVFILGPHLPGKPRNYGILLGFVVSDLVNVLFTMSWMPSPRSIRLYCFVRLPSSKLIENQRV